MMSCFYKARRALLLTTSFWMCVSDSAGYSPPIPELYVHPTSVLTRETPTGMAQTHAVTIENIGSAPAFLGHITAEVGSSEFKIGWSGPSGQTHIAVPGINRLPWRLLLEPRERITLIVRFTPRDGQYVGGVLKLSSNAPSQHELVIPIELVRPEPKLQMSHAQLPFGQVSTSDKKQLTARISNNGNAPLSIFNVTIWPPTPEFTPFINGYDPRVKTGVLTDPDGDGEPGIAPGSAIDLVLEYDPFTAGADVAELSFYTNDPLRPVHLVTLSGEGVEP
ncbi:MAG: hypothetical protein ACE366_12490 [Bradymonadia bacterium]